MREQIRLADAWHVALERTSPVVWKTSGDVKGDTDAGEKMAGATLSNVNKGVETAPLQPLYFMQAVVFPYYLC